MQAAVKQRALASVGSVARYVPHDATQIFSFVASPRVRANPWVLYQRLHASGIHHCLGAALARLEAAVAIPAILRALTNLALAGRPRWRQTFVLRGFTSLPVRWTP